MPRTTSNSFLPIAASLLAVAFAVFVGWRVLSGGSQATPPDSPSSSLPSTVENAPSGAASGSQVLPPPEVAQPVRAISPEAESPLQVAANDAHTTALVSTDAPEIVAGAVAPTGRVRVTGRIITTPGASSDGAGVWYAEAKEKPLREAVRAALASSELMIAPAAGGVFSIDLNPGRSYFVGLSLHGTPLPIVQEVTPQQKGVVLETDFDLPAPFLIRGAVLDESRRPVPGVRLSAEWRPTAVLAGLSRPVAVELTADNEGSFEFPVTSAAEATVSLDRGSMGSRLLHDGTPIRLGMQELGSGRSYRIEFRVVHSAELQARVTSAENGAPLSGAEVRAVPRNPSFPTRTARTDASGRATITTLHPESCDVVISHNAHVGQVLRDVTPGSELIAVKLEVMPGILGRIEPAPAQGARVELQPRSGSPELRLFTDASRDGTFGFPRVAPGEYMLSARSEGPSAAYGETVVVVVAGVEADEIVVGTRPLVSVSGRLVGQVPSGGYESIEVVAAPEVEPLFPDAVSPDGESIRLRPAATISDSGEFLIADLFPGEKYVVSVKERESGRVLGGAAISDVANSLAIALRGAGSIRGRVLGLDGTACVGEEVALTTGLGSIEGSIGDVQERTAKTRFDGSYEFRFVPTGQARVRLSSDERTARLVNVLPDEALTQDFQCRQFVEVDFQLTASAGEISGREQILLIPQPGTESNRPVIEIYSDNPQARLEPGKYTITRTRTMESQTVEVLPRAHGTIAVTFETDDAVN